MRVAKAKSSKTKSAKTKNSKIKKSKPKSATAKRAKPEPLRPFRFNAAQTVQILFKGEKKPEGFRVDDMVDATMATLDGQTKFYFQYRLVSNDRKRPDGLDRSFWFFDPKPVGTTDTMDPSLWQPVREQPLDGHEVLKQHSGNFSTRSVTSYDGSGVRHIVKLDDKPAYRMQLDLNGQRECCESLPVTIRKGDVLVVGG
jgi:hypothetical protein